MWFFGCCQASRKEFVSRLLLSQITFIFSGLITASICAFMLNVPKINVLNEIFCIVNFRSFSVKNAILAEIREEIFLAHVFINKKKRTSCKNSRKLYFFVGGNDCSTRLIFSIPLSITWRSFHSLSSRVSRTKSDETRLLFITFKMCFCF